ncbi:hypothetical protein B0J13DRAFT_535493 [Dactylonectria estremocensis]|uniref:Myb-like domain-containing protein n=1 Tax=Dactylonectria estremocensis TaxID=1079267 RepID=A0A9P9FI85_9HYPO|nr:hypothetical protein B0J13DRAFT_535493 [Dactylonectria estremocensis]
MVALNQNNRDQAQARANSNSNSDGDRHINVTLISTDDYGSMSLLFDAVYYNDIDHFSLKGLPHDSRDWPHNQRHARHIIGKCIGFLDQAADVCQRSHLGSSDNLDKVRNTAVEMGQYGVALFNVAIRMMYRNQNKRTAGFETMDLMARIRDNESVNAKPLTKAEEQLQDVERAILIATRPLPKNRDEEDLLLLYCRFLRFSYKEIVQIMRTGPNESTLRGRFRNMIRTEDERARVQKWSHNDIMLFEAAVYIFDIEHASNTKDAYHKFLRDFIHSKGGKYFSTAEIKKRLIATNRLAAEE